MEALKPSQGDTGGRELLCNAGAPWKTAVSIQGQREASHMLMQPWRTRRLAVR